MTAAGLFARSGFDETNTNMIAREAGISVGSIYTYFKDKWEIFLVILEEHSKMVLDHGKQNMERILDENLDLETAANWFIPGLYSINKRSGNLNHELARFIHVDKRAAAVHEKWERMEDQVILQFLNHFEEELNIPDPESAATIINLQLRSVFYYLFDNQGKVNEKAILSQFTKMLLRSVQKN